MEFLVSNLAVDDRKALLDHLTALRISEEAHVSANDYGKFRLYINGASAQGALNDFAFDGSAIFDNRLVTLFRNNDLATLRELRRVAGARLSDVVGCFCLVSVNKAKQRFQVQFDALNAYPCFVYRRGDRYAVSNNIHFIDAIVTAAGTRLTRTVLPYLGDFALGSAYDVGSPYEEVEIVRPRQSLEGGDGLRVLERAIGADDVTGGASYEESLAHAGERLRGRIEVIADAFPETEVFFDLTGGMDSRMVLAAIVSRAPRLHWDYRTLFDHPHPDGHCAALIGERFGLGRTEGIPPDLRRLMSPFERMRFETFASMGVGAKEGWTIRPANRDVAQLHGCYGEIAGSSPDGKRFLSREGPLTYPALADTYVARLGALGILDFFTTRGVEWLRERLVSRLGHYRDAGMPAADAPLRYYNDGRLRSHFGVISRQRSQNRNYVDILYDMHLEFCALKVPPLARVKGKVNFDLIRQIGGDAIVGLPLADAQWDPSLFASPEERLALRAPAITAGTPKSFGSSPERKKLAPLAEDAVSFRSRPDPNLPAYDIGKIAPAYRDIFRRQVFLSTYLSQTRVAGGLDGLVDWAKVDAVLAAPPETLGRYPTNMLLIALCDSVIWHQKMELSVFA
ncbi:MAG: hypothetical protein KDK07_19405 [Bauldia sp.]|nr:hypothetical protein [Bauldia sp.]